MAPVRFIYHIKLRYATTKDGLYAAIDQSTEVGLALMSFSEKVRMDQKTRVTSTICLVQRI